MLKAVLVNEKKNMNMMIREMINWNSLGIAVTATAETGDEALEKIMTELPDIVIMNAKLKGMSVSEVVRIARDNGVSPDYIIISGLRSFEAVYSALKCGVTEYLVGALDLKELTETLKKVCAKRMQNELDEQNEAKERRLFEMNKDIIRRHFISNVLNGSIDTVNTINRVNGEFLFNFRPGAYEVAIVCPDFADGSSMTRAELENLLDEMGMVISDQIGKRCMEHVWFRKRSVIICVLNYTGDMHDDYEKLFERLSRIVRERDGVVTIALGTVEDELRNIRKSLSAAERSLGYRLTLGTDKIIPYGMVHFSDVKLEEIFTGGIERRMKSSIVAFNSGELRSAIMDLFETMDSIEDIDPTLYWDVSNKIADMLLESLKDKNIFIGSIDTMTNDFKRMILLSPTPAHICATVSSWAATIIERVVYDENTKESRTIRIAKAYIKDHYMEQVKLEELARVTNLNSSYFSTLFKKETGQNFSEFLIDCRLNESKKLLKETALTINEITEKIGYSDSKYFSKLFVKSVGITPSEYRKIYA